MARRRYQKGSVIPRGGSWELRWKEDVIENGELRRVHRSKSISEAEFPTKRLARRELDRLMEEAGTACHGFRHGAATKLDELGTPLATRQQRMGHADPDTLMGYTHAVNEEDRKVSAAFGAVLSHAFSKNEPAKEIPQQLSLQLSDSEAAA